VYYLAASVNPPGETPDERKQRLRRAALEDANNQAFTPEERAKALKAAGIATA
jgi:hypothetical protein